MVDFKKLLSMTPAEREAHFKKALDRAEHVGALDADAVVFVSPSQHEVFELCKRKWAFKYIDGAPRVETDKQKFGTEGHDIAAEWFRRGTIPPKTEAGEAFKQGMANLPAPHPDLLVEAGLELELDGNVVMIGFMDLLQPPHLRTPKVPKVFDHKFTSDLRYAKKPEELREDAQAVVYSVAAMEQFGTREVDGAWHYYGFSGPNHKPTGTKVVPFHHTVDSATRPWNRILGQSHEIARLRRAPGLKAVDVEPTTTACAAFGGCEFADICPLPKGSVLSGHMKQFEKLHKESNTDTIHAALTGGTEPMASLTDKLNAKKAAEAAKAGGKPATGPSTNKSTKPDETKKEEATTPAPGGQGLLDKMKKMQKGATGVNPPAAEGDAPSTPAPATTTEEKPASKPRAASSGTKRIVVLLNAVCVKNVPPNTKYLVDLLAPCMAHVAEENGVAHWNLVEYAKGASLLAVAFDTVLDEFSGTIVVDSDTPEARAVKEVLYARADVIIRGT